MPGNFDRDPLDVIAVAIAAGEDEVRQAEEYVEQCEKATKVARLELDVKREHLQVWVDVRAAVVGG